MFNSKLKKTLAGAGVAISLATAVPVFEPNPLSFSEYFELIELYDKEIQSQHIIKDVKANRPIIEILNKRIVAKKNNRDIELIKKTQKINLISKIGSIWQEK